MARKPQDKPKSKAEIKAAADRAEKRAKTTKKADTLPKTATGKVAAQPADPTDYVAAAVNKGYKLPSQNDVRNLLKQCKGLKDDLDETTGLIREKIGYMVDKKNLNKKAFAELRKLDKMGAEKLADYWDTLMAYMDMAGLMEKMASVTRLPLGDGEAKTEEGDDDADKVLAAKDSHAASGAGEEPAPPTEEVSRPRLAAVAGQQIPA